jgi:hypothetical protein
MYPITDMTTIIIVLVIIVAIAAAFIATSDKDAEEIIFRSWVIDIKSGLKTANYNNIKELESSFDSLVEFASVNKLNKDSELLDLFDLIKDKKNTLYPKAEKRF